MRTAFINEIVSAIESNEIRAYFQPQYDANTGKLVSAEALVRWVKPDGSIIIPDSFIPRLEQTQDINILDWFMAEEACRAILELGEAAVPVAVNFSRWHVKEPDFARKLQSLLATYGVEPKMFEVEITESSLASAKFSEIEKWAYEVAEIGVKIAIDDFGAGFTSLQFVKDMPVTYLKVDKAFLKDNCQDDRGRGTLETVFYFAHRLNLMTIAEGVETVEQLKFMQSMDCNKLQGYLFSKPLPKEDFIMLAMMDDVQVIEEEDNYIRRQGTLSSHNLLLKAVKQEYQLIIFGNLYKNSYYVMSQETGKEFKASTAGAIDDLTSKAIELCVEEDKGKYESMMSRAALIDAFERGKNRIELTFTQLIDDSYDTFHTIVYLSNQPYKKDILMVGMSRLIERVSASKSSQRLKHFSIISTDDADYTDDACNH